MPRVRRLYRKGPILFPLSAWVLGIFVYFHQTLLSGFEKIQGGPGDTRLINFILEHSYRWLRQVPPHCSFFDPPVFYPQANVSSYTDLLLGVAPFYWLWRLAGFQPDTAYQLWMIVLATLNFIAAYLLLKHFFSCCVIGSSIGSLIFAFGTVQHSKLVHQQLVPQFYVLLALMALLTVFRDRGKSQPSQFHCTAILVFALAMTAQFYTAFYTFFFLALVCACALAWALLIPSWRKEVLRLVHGHYIWIGISVVVASLLLLPALLQYFSALQDVGNRPLRPRSLARIYDWFLTSDDNLLYGWISAGLARFVRGSTFWSSGFLTMALCCIGLARQCKRTSLQLMVLATVTTALLTTHITAQFGLWPYVREIVPGAKALRAVGRVAMVQLIPVTIGIGIFFQGLVQRRRWPLLLLLGSICILEQLNIGSRNISKPGLRKDIASIAAAVDPDCRAFFLFSSQDLENLAELASWTTLVTQKPTINGRYGNFPPHYPILLRRAQKFPGSIARTQLEAALLQWCNLHKLPFGQIQVIDLSQNPGKTPSIGQ